MSSLSVEEESIIANTVIYYASEHNPLWDFLNIRFSVVKNERGQSLFSELWGSFIFSSW